MKKLIIKRAGKKGKGLFAGRGFKKGELILKHDLKKLKRYSLKQIGELVKKGKITKEESEHSDYVGRGKYVIDFHPFSYINHSCEPNVLIRHRTMSEREVFAMRDIKKGEELTCDYGVNALDQFGKTNWVMKCGCGSKNCRKTIPGDFFRQPKSIQKKYLKYLPSSIKRRYRERIEELR